MLIIWTVLQKDSVFTFHNEVTSSDRNFVSESWGSQNSSAREPADGFSRGRRFSLPFSQLQLLVAPQPLMLLGPTVSPHITSSFFEEEPVPPLNQCTCPVSSAKTQFPGKAPLRSSS